MVSGSAWQQPLQNQAILRSRSTLQPRALEPFLTQKNTNPLPPDALEARVTELETRIAFQEDLLNTLNDVIAAQDQQLVTVTRKLDALLKQIEEQQRQSGYGGAGGDAMAHEPPPHY